MSYTEQVRVHLARAFIMNPEVMVLQRPLCHFGEHASKHMLEVIREHIQNRGLCLPEESRGRRRPRTVFFSNETVAQAAAADIIWVCDQNTQSVREMNREHLQNMTPENMPL